MIVDRCPHCGCNDIEEITAVGAWGLPGRRVSCNFCGEFSTLSEDAEAIPETIFQRLRCPHCQSAENEVTATRRRSGEPTLRYHRCRDCSGTFKSREG